MMRKNSIEELQISCLSRINFCFYELKRNPFKKFVNNIFVIGDLEATRRNFFNLTVDDQITFRKNFVKHLNEESTALARFSLIINYIYALLFKGRNNQISLYKNFDNSVIDKFKEENGDLMDRIKDFRDKQSSHIDLDWQQYCKNISFDEIQCCIDFFNKLLHYDVESFNRDCQLLQGE